MNDAAFDQRRLDMLVSHSRSLRVPMWLSAIAIAAVAGREAGWAPALGWLLFFLAVREARAAALIRLAEAVARPIAQRLRRTVDWSLVLGLAHGSAALFMLELDTTSDALLSMVLMSLSAGAVSTTYTVVPAFSAYSLAIALPVATAWLFNGDPLGWAVALLILLFAVVQIRFARHNMGMFEESFRIRQEKEGLLRQLGEERERLAAARDAAVQADIAKSQFLASASHDLRQPLQSLTLNAGALHRLALPGEGPQIAADIVAGLEALRQMLDGLLDVSKLDAGAVAPRFQPLPLDRLLGGLQSRLRPSAAAKGLSLEVDCPAGLVVLSDVDLLQRVLSNLLDNAIKFTAQGGVRLSAWLDDDQVVISVVDTGIGIPEAEQARIFDDLVQLGNPERDRSRGHGLGLGIVRRLVPLLGGRCWVVSRPGQGSRFNLRLPADRPSRDMVLDDGHQARPALIARRVLVLDDEASVRSAYRHALRSLGCEVASAATLTEALQQLAGSAAEVVLVDYRLANGLDGFGALRALRAQVPGLPAVMVSADTGTALEQACAALGVPLLHKPVSEALLALAINQALGAAQAPLQGGGEHHEPVSEHGGVDRGAERHPG